MKKCFFYILLLSQFGFAQKAEMFLPELFKDLPNVRDFSMAKNQDEFYFTIESYAKEYSFIAYSKKINDKWTAPKEVSFSGQHKDLEPFLSPDGLKLFFASNRKNNTSSEIKKDIDIWYVTRKSKNDKWSNPKNIGQIINTSADEFYPSVNNTGDLFFTAQYENSKGKEDIYVSRFINGSYTKPTSLSSAVNSKKYEFNAFVAPDESFIIFTSYGRKDDLGRGDLYISRKDKNNNWLPAEHLDVDINSKKLDYCPFVDINNNVLYFTTNKSSIPKNFKKRKNLEEIIDYINTNPNGLSRIYRSSFNKK
ncbi:PD40 domain-containing protein [Tenacibaculum sp. S7007]|uniref:PD40 domain-containing protein n=1 Tax=Tenacibaculum pelagium TaxID=2759527 RepID=A0A839APS8_9FLAO|nr:PD40 domain-containing protein [Tenacibaculum pelagium]MBA6157095.1 PD40 domain-containing protein [Tenacibaculum pelagium]